MQCAHIWGCMQAASDSWAYCMQCIVVCTAARMCSTTVPTLPLSPACSGSPTASLTVRICRHAGLQPRDIDILVVNCSLFCPTPSLSAMLVNHFKMRTDVVSYNLGGMGCSAGVIAVGLAEKLLQVTLVIGRLYSRCQSHAWVQVPALWATWGFFERRRHRSRREAAAGESRILRQQCCTYNSPKYIQSAVLCIPQPGRHELAPPASSPSASPGSRYNFFQAFLLGFHGPAKPTRTSSACI